MLVDVASTQSPPFFCGAGLFAYEAADRRPSGRLFYASWFSGGNLDHSVTSNASL